MGDVLPGSDCGGAALTFDDWLAISLTCVTVVLAVLAVLIAVLAVWGYKGIKDEARRIALAESSKRISDHLAGKEFRDTLEGEVRKRIEQESDRLFYDFSLATAFPQQASGEAASNPVASEYPKEDDQ